VIDHDLPAILTPARDRGDSHIFMDSLCPSYPAGFYAGNTDMLTLVRIPRSSRSAAATAELIADYTAFDRQRAHRRQYVKAFGGLAVVVALGALFRFEPRREALVAAGLFAAPPAVLTLIEAWYWRRLVRRMKALRANVRQGVA
jgi:hypothetical protein